MALAQGGGHVVSMRMGSVSGTFAAVKKRVRPGELSIKDGFLEVATGSKQISSRDQRPNIYFSVIEERRC